MYWCTPGHATCHVACHRLAKPFLPRKMQQINFKQSLQTKDAAFVMPQSTSNKATPIVVVKTYSNASNLT